MEKHQVNQGYSQRRILFIPSGSPNVANLITTLVEAAEKRDRVAVAAYGSDSLMRYARRQQ
jgi:hypothetical protein